MINSDKKHHDNIILGMSAGLAAFFMLAVMNVFAKLLSETHHVIEIAFYRNLIATLPFLFMIFILKKREIMKINSRKKGVIARAIIGTVSLITTFAAFAAMPMADTTAFLFTASLIIPILGFFFLGEKVGIYRWGAVLIGFIGVLVMLSPSGEINMIGVALALSAATMHAVLQTILRYLGKTEKPKTITFYFVLIGTFVAAIPLPFVASMPTMAELPLFIAVGFSGLAAQYLLSIAFGNAPAAVVTVFNYSGIIWATIFGWMIWSDWPAHTIWIGGGIVIASNIFIIWRESRKGKVTGDRIRAKL
ncbi:MAG: DMT family transporter [Alphaproteobacteria bacterium]|nr:DMT family transporter [Alphaproteobacteria bacterium]NCQ89145.1 DMT family transporter [Alphaproteobacteria bacterium]NCT08249.1 DMT family transporter [Alphaproteobacteria bacterium]